MSEKLNRPGANKYNKKHPHKKAFKHIKGEQNSHTFYVDMGPYLPTTHRLKKKENDSW